MNTDHSFANAQEMRAVREAAFANTMDVVCQRHPHYQALMRQQGLSRADFKSLSDLALLPLTHKADYMAAPEQFTLHTEGLPIEMQTVWDTMYTTGSTGGKPTPFVSTSFDFFNILALQRNMLRLRGVHSQDVIANLFPLTPAPHGAWIRVLHAAASMNVRVFSAMPGQTSPYFGLGHGLDDVVQLVQSPWFLTKVSAPMKNALADALASQSTGRMIGATQRIIASLPSQLRDQFKDTPQETAR
jgi:phenylacetate-CoA ligase